MARPDELTFAPLGGVGEIGMNLSIYGLGNRHQRSFLAVDLGVSFGDEEHLPGIDLIMPDVRFLEKERHNLMGLVLTHAHEDHFGAIIDLWPRLGCKIYATQFSAALFEAKCAAERNPPKIPITVIPSGGRVDIGPFNVEFIPVAHSIPESHALAIKTDVGTVLHTGDWKIDPTPVIGLPTDERRLRELGDEGVLALVGDSTNAVRDGRSPSETEVAATIKKLVKAAKGRVAVTTFASNVARVRAVVDAANAADREVVVVGRAMERVVQVARECGYLDASHKFRSPDYYGHFPADKVLALCTGSQGEPRAALARIANNDHPQVTLNKGDTVIFSSRTIPGNEKAVGGIINGLVTQGVEIITDREHLVHVSGHPRRDELRDMISWVRPQLLIPVHGEARPCALRPHLQGRQPDRRLRGNGHRRPPQARLRRPCRRQHPARQPLRLHGRSGSRTLRPAAVRRRGRGHGRHALRRRARGRRKHPARAPQGSGNGARSRAPRRTLHGKRDLGQEARGHGVFDEGVIGAP
jgi:ribonuclease J